MKANNHELDSIEAYTTQINHLKNLLIKLS